VKVCQPKQEINSLVNVTIPERQEASVDEQPTSREQIYKRKQDDIIRQIQSNMLKSEQLDQLMISKSSSVAQKV
jgi:hypothetical protein